MMFTEYETDDLLLQVHVLNISLSMASLLLKEEFVLAFIFFLIGTITV